MRVAFAPDCCDRKAKEHVATTGYITTKDVQDLMVATVEHSYCRMNCVLEPIEWMTVSGNYYIRAIVLALGV